MNHVHNKNNDMDNTTHTPMVIIPVINSGIRLLSSGGFET